MEQEEIPKNNVLNLQCVNFNQWSQKDYDNIKKAKNMNRSLRGSQIVMDVIANLRVRGVYTEMGKYNYNDDREANHNMVFQRSYGYSFKQFLEANKPNMRQLLDMRRVEGNVHLFEVRSQMADWMIEVLTHYNKERGSNEYTYFKALLFLDLLIARGLVNVENIHVYGIACMYLASNLLDTLGIDLRSAYENIAHRAFDENKLLRYINRAIEGLEFNFRVPTWIEYLDKVIFDTFGDYRDNLAEFNIRQNAIFVLHACAFDVKFYGWDPFKLAITALMYSINSFFNKYEEHCNKKHENVELLRAQSSKENIVAHLLQHSGMNRTVVLQNLVAFNEYMGGLMLRIRDSTYAQLKGLFKFAD